MATSYLDYLKDLKPAGSTPVNSGIPSLSAYTPPSTSNSGSTSSYAQPKTQLSTGKAIAATATQGVTPQSTVIPVGKNIIQSTTQGLTPQSTVVPTGKNIVQNATQGVTPQSTVVPNQSYLSNDNQSDTSSERYTPPPLSKGESTGVAKDYGLKGLKDNSYSGLTMAQAQQKAATDKKAYQDSTSAGTSYTYNAASISGFNDKSRDMRTKLDTAKNDAFTSTQQKKSDADGIIKSYTKELAGLFTTPAEFQNALTNSPEIQKSVQDYQRAGGQLSDIASNIGVKERQNVQTLDQYLGRGSNPAEQKAYDSLIPEKQAYQDQISFEQNVPQQYKDLFFGTPERVGILEREKTIAQEKVKNLQEQSLKKDITDRAKADLTIQKNQAELDNELATTEQNRLSARNYSTRALAKLGALNTTGAAVEKLTSLEQRYQLQSQGLRTKYNFKAKEIEGNLNETLNETEAKKQDAIVKIKEDLSKSEVKIAEEIMKLNVTSSREIYKITDKYLSEYRTQKDKYVKEAKAEAEKNAKAAAKIASTYDVSGLSNLTFDNFLKSKSTGGEATKIAGNSEVGGMDVITGGQTFDPNQTQKMYPGYLKALIQSGAVSPETQEVLTGKKTVTDLTANEAKIAKAELKKLGVNPNIIQTASKPDIESALSGAQSAIDTIDASDKSNDEKDNAKKKVKQAFIGKFPEKSATWNSYFKE